MVAFVRASHQLSFQVYAFVHLMLSHQQVSPPMAGGVALCAGLLVRSASQAFCLWSVGLRCKDASTTISNTAVFLSGGELFLQFATTDESGSRASVTAVRVNGWPKNKADRAQLWLVAVFHMYVEYYTDSTSLYFHGRLFSVGCWNPKNTGH
jgi:hypothetical protein